MIDEKMNIKILTQKDLIDSGCFNVCESIRIAEYAFKEYATGNVIFPDKISVVFNQNTQDRINCLPAALLSQNVYGMKWVSVFPENPHTKKLPNLTAVILLSELETGFPLVFMEGSLCSNLRTAAVGAVAAKYFAKKCCDVIGFIGAGEQAKAHFLSMKAVHPEIRECKVASRSSESEVKFIEQMRKIYQDVEFVACQGIWKDAVVGSDIIVTAISGQDKILQADWIEDGAFYCHVGGLEDDFLVAKKAAKIVCDNWNMVKHRTQTISQMYKCGLLTDKDIYADLHEVIIGDKPGRENDNEFIYFNSVGMSFVDVALAKWMFDKTKEQRMGREVTLKENSMFDFEPI